MFDLIQLIDKYLSHSLLSVINPTSTLLYHIHYNILYHTLNPSLYPFISLPPTSYPLSPLILCYPSLRPSLPGASRAFVVTENHGHLGPPRFGHSYPGTPQPPPTHPSNTPHTLTQTLLVAKCSYTSQTPICSLTLVLPDLVILTQVHHHPNPTPHIFSLSLPSLTLSSYLGTLPHIVPLTPILRSLAI